GSERAIGPAPDLPEIAGNGGSIEAADHRLDRADSGRRHRQRPEAKRDQRHRLDRAAGTLAAHAERYSGIAGLGDDLAEESKHRHREGIVAIGQTRIAAVTG